MTVRDKMFFRCMAHQWSFVLKRLKPLGFYWGATTPPHPLQIGSPLRTQNKSVLVSLSVIGSLKIGWNLDEAESFRYYWDRGAIQIQFEDLFKLE